MSLHYIRVEGVNIANFVADTKDLSTIRGGGLILLDSISDLHDNFKQLKPISTGASSGLFEYDGAKDEAYKLLGEMNEFLESDPKYKYATFVLSIVDADDTGHFVRDKETLIARNRWQQMSSPFVAIPSHNEDINVNPCSENKLRPAKEAGEGKISRSVSERQDYGREQKQVFYEQQIGRSLTTNPNQTRKFTKDFEDLATFTNESINPNLNRKMAVIYVDGNKFGAIQTKHCLTAEIQKEFDANLQGFRRQLLSDFVDYMEAHDHWLAADNRYRLETLLWGGDEILWVVPAWQGWATIEFFYQQAQMKNWEFAGTPLTHSAGVVFCNHKAPIHRVRKLAEELANSVKDKIEPNSNVFAYEILESFDHIGRDVEEYRHERIPVSLRSKEGTSALILDANVVFKTGGTNVIEIISKLKDTLPRRRLSNIVKELLKEDSQNEVEKQVVELLGEVKESRDELRQLFKRFGGISSGNDAVDLVGQPMMWMHLNALWDYLATE
jgi:hypothetical protein